MSKEKKLTFESALARLEEIARLLESGDSSLEESLQMYEEGMQLIAFCNKKLTEAEAKVQKLVKTADGGFATEELDKVPGNNEEQNNG
ncbi:MAG: exodeoxyribonuclease VII small subunit [Calditrichaeota bacterium]|nr:MAG: exodeoxyribonuclease VII small subunit [Calditrichota bacterium]